jgi:hypothetical protein
MGQTLRKVYDFSVEAPSLFLYIGEMQLQTQLLTANATEPDTQSSLTLDSSESAEHLEFSQNTVEKQDKGQTRRDKDDIQPNDNESNESDILQDLEKKQQIYSSTLA